MASNELIAQFQMITGVNVDAARTYLSSASNNLEQALQRYFDADIAPPEQFAEPVVQVNFAPVEQVEEEEDDYEQCSLQVVQAATDANNNNNGAKKRAGVPLRGQTVKVVVLENGLADVSIVQRYVNDGSEPIECVFVFFAENAAVYRFVASMGGKRLVGRVQERGEAFKRYDDAISGGHGAALLEQDAPDAFSVSVGGLLAGGEAVIELRYVAEIDVSDLRASLTLPATNARFVLDGDADQGSDDVENGLRVFVQWHAAPSDQIVDIEAESPHSLGQHRVNERTVNVWLADPELAIAARAPLVLLCRLAHPLAPHAVVEQFGNAPLDEFFGDQQSDESSPSSSSSASAPSGSSKTAMISFVQNVELDDDPLHEVIVVADCSGSMAGSRIRQMKQALQLFLRSVPLGSYFNIVKFGGAHEALFAASRAYSDGSLAQATAFVNAMDASMGGTNILDPLRFVFSRAQRDGRAPRQVLIVTDGEVGNTERVIDLVKDEARDCRVFSLGIGGEASRRLVRGVARAGRGHCEFVASGESIEAKVMSLIGRILEPPLRDLRIDVGDSLKLKSCVPTELPALFFGQRLLVFAELADDSPSTSGTITLRGVAGDDTELEFVAIVDFAHQGSVVGNAVHRMAARATIQELLAGRTAGGLLGAHQEPKQAIVELSTRYHLVSPHTSLVCVEWRDDATPIDDLKVVDVRAAADERARRDEEQRRSSSRRNSGRGFGGGSGGGNAFGGRGGGHARYGSSRALSAAGAPPAPASAPGAHHFQQHQQLAAVELCYQPAMAAAPAFDLPDSLPLQPRSALPSMRSKGYSGSTFDPANRNRLRRMGSAPKKSKDMKKKEKSRKSDRATTNAYDNDDCDDDSSGSDIADLSSRYDAEFTAEPARELASGQASAAAGDFASFQFNAANDSSDEEQSPVAVSSQLSSAPSSSSSSSASLPADASSFDRIVLLQAASGSWQLTAQLATAVGVDLAVLTAHAKELGSDSDASPLSSALATAVALACLAVKHADMHVQWKLLARKANRWLQKAFDTDQVKAIESFARSLVLTIQ
jgi:von Willebrand factor A domain-containing protein 5